MPNLMRISKGLSTSICQYNIELIWLVCSIGIHIAPLKDTLVFSSICEILSKYLPMRTRNHYVYCELPKRKRGSNIQHR